MKTLRNFVVTGGLLRSNGDQAQVGDTVRLYPYEGDPFLATIEAVAPVNCGQDRAYAIEYDLDVVLRVCDLQDMGDVLDCCGLLDERVDVLEDVYVPFFGPKEDSSLKDMWRAFQGLSFSYPIVIASSHIGLSSPLERPIMGISRDGGLTFESIQVNYIDCPSVDGPRDCAFLWWNEAIYLFYTAGSFGAVPYFGIAKSTGEIDGDGKLIFRHHTNVDLPPLAGSTYVWAPEPVIHNGKVYVVFSRNVGGSWFLYRVESSDPDLVSWSPQEDVVTSGEPPSSKIDATFIRYENKWLMLCRFIDSNTPRGMLLFESEDSPVGPFTYVGNPLSSELLEGGSLVDMGEGRIRMYAINLAGSPAKQVYSDSKDGGLTWTPIVEAEGDFSSVAHATYRSYLDPATPQQRLFDKPSTAVVAKVSRSSTQNILTGPGTGPQRVLLNTVDFDTADMVVDEDGVIEIPLAGVYQIEASVGFDSISPTATPRLVLSVLVNGLEIATDELPDAGVTDSNPIRRVSCHAKLSKGDQVTIQVYQDSSVTMATTANPPRRPQLSVALIGV